MARSGACGRCSGRRRCGLRRPRFVPGSVLGPANTTTNHPSTKSLEIHRRPQQRSRVRSSAFLSVRGPQTGSRNATVAVILAAFAPLWRGAGSLVQTCGGQTTPNGPHERNRSTLEPAGPPTPPATVPRPDHGPWQLPTPKAQERTRHPLPKARYLFGETRQRHPGKFASRPGRSSPRAATAGEVPPPVGADEVPPTVGSGCVEAAFASVLVRSWGLRSLWPMTAGSSLVVTAGVVSGA